MIQPLTKENESAFERVEFNSQGETLVGNLYLPDNADNASGTLPAIAIVGPMTYQKEQAPSEYAQRFAQKGYAALVFDPRYRGESSGEPRAFENPNAKVEDIHAAVDFLAQRNDVNADKIMGMGVCQGSSSMLKAMAENDHIQAAATVAGHYRDHEGDIEWLTEEGYQARLEKGQKAKDKFEQTGEIDYVAAVDEEDMDVGMPGKFVWDWYHHWADKGLWENRYAVMSDAELLTFESISAAKTIEKPYLMIHSDYSFLPAAAKRHFEAMPSKTKKLLWEGETPHLSYYDQPDILDRTANQIDEYFKAV